MKRIEFYIKLLAVLLIIALSTLSYGAELIARLEDGADNDLILPLTREYADVKYPNSILDNRRNAIKQGKAGEMPFLVKGIKYKCIGSNETLVYVNSNQKMVYSIPLGVCVYYSYDCEIKAERLTEEECAERVKRCISTVFANFKNVKITSIENISDEGGIRSFDVKTSLTGDGKIRVSVRKDTGSIVLYDARGVEIWE